MVKTNLIWHEGVTLREILQKLDENGNGILPVVDEQQHLLGIVTDGDVRRGLLKENNDIKSMINFSCKSVSSSMPRHSILQLLREKHLRHMPVVDEQNRLVEVVVLDEFTQDTKDNYVVIMAGGLGSRLGELTKDTPKPMLPVGGKPVLERIIVSFRDQGFNRFILCVNYKADVIKKYFGDGSAFNVHISYTEEKEKKGTAGALSLIDREKLRDPFFVINGDVLTNIDYRDFLESHSRASACASMVVKQYEEYIPYACVKFDERTEEMQYVVEKPRNIHFINAGVYILNSGCLESIPSDGFFDMPSLFETLLEQKQKVKIYRMDNQWIDIGYPNDYNKANNLYQTEN